MSVSSTIIKIVRKSSQIGSERLCRVWGLKTTFLVKESTMGGKLNLKTVIAQKSRMIREWLSCVIYFNIHTCVSQNISGKHYVLHMLKLGLGEINKLMNIYSPRVW